MDDRKATRSNEKQKSGKPTWSDLPTDLLKLILRHLSLVDNIRSSVVCKGWHTAAISVRVANQPPWLMYFPKYGNVYEFYDPARRMIHSCEFPDIYGTEFCYSKDGWLLLYGPRRHRMFFFNPFTRQKIKLPRFELTNHRVAFSCAPTSKGCVVFTVGHISPTTVAISTCHLEAKEWVSVDYENPLSLVCSISSKVLFCCGLFYCLSLYGRLGIFDPMERTWNVLVVPPPICSKKFFVNNWLQAKFVAVHNEELVLIYTRSDENPVVFKLDRSEMIWEEMRTLDGATIFASLLSSHSRTDVLGIARNSIYFSKFRFFGKRCISYSLDKCRYYPRNQCYDWRDLGSYENIWIQPPEDFSTFASEQDQ